jgi:hypothetical protein
VPCAGVIGVWCGHGSGAGQWNSSERQVHSVGTSASAKHYLNRQPEYCFSQFFHLKRQRVPFDLHPTPIPSHGPGTPIARASQALSLRVSLTLIFLPPPPLSLPASRPLSPLPCNALFLSLPASSPLSFSSESPSLHPHPTRPLPLYLHWWLCLRRSKS